MALMFSYYDKEKLVDYCWYNSSNVLYSECYDNPNNLKDLFVVFNNGAKYHYKEVDVNDYVIFKVGGLDGSHGKALNKIIKQKYVVEKAGDVAIEDIKNQRVVMENLKAQAQSPKEVINESEEIILEK